MWLCQHLGTFRFTLLIVFNEDIVQYRQGGSKGRPLNNKRNFSLLLSPHGPHQTLNFFLTSVHNSESKGIENFRLDIGNDVRVPKPKCAKVPTQPHLQVVPIVEAQ